MKLFQKLRQGQTLASLPLTETVLAAARLMAERMVGSVVVMEGKKLVGIFTERDLLNRVIAPARDPQKVRLSEVMSRDVVTVGVNDSIESCYAKMQETKCRHVPIVENDQVVGMVTMRNILEWLWEEIEEENAYLRKYIQQS